LRTFFVRKLGLSLKGFSYAYFALYDEMQALNYSAFSKFSLSGQNKKDIQGSVYPFISLTLYKYKGGMGESFMINKGGSL
jgi:hypothetical protein